MSATTDVAYRDGPLARVFRNSSLRAIFGHGPVAGDVARMDLAAYFRSARHHAWRSSRPERQGLVAWFSQALMGKTCLRRNFVGAGLSFPGSSEDNRFDHVQNEESWRPAGQGIRHSRVQSISVSRSERANGRGIVYAGIEPSAIFRSEDAGTTGTTVRGTLRGTRISCQSILPHQTDRIRRRVMGISRAATEATLGNDSRRDCGTDTCGASP
jgi:hypothetical protein